MGLPWKFFVKGFFTLSALCVSFGVVRAEGDNCPPVIKRLGKDSRQQVESYIRAAVYPNDIGEIIYVDGYEPEDSYPEVIKRNRDYRIRVGLQAVLAPSSSKLFAAAIIQFEKEFRLRTGLSGKVTSDESLNSTINIVFFDIKDGNFSHNKLLEFVADGMDDIGLIQKFELAYIVDREFLNENDSTCLVFNTVDSNHIILDSTIVINSQMPDNGVVNCLTKGMFSSFGIYSPPISSNDDFSDSKIDHKINELLIMLDLNYSSFIQEGYSRADIEKNLEIAMRSCN